MKIIGKLKINFKFNQFFNKNIWKSFKNENFIRKSKKASSITYGQILRKTLNKEQIVEFDFIKKLSEKFIIDNYNRNPTFQKILKTSIGYTIGRTCSLKSQKFCSWTILINIDTNEVILSCSKECQHKYPIKYKGFLILI
jgi:hypothetical protein